MLTPEAQIQDGGNENSIVHTIKYPRGELPYETDGDARRLA